MAYAGLTVEYMVKTTGDNWFIPGNCVAPTNSHDNQDNGNVTQRVEMNLLCSPDGKEKVVT